MGIKVKKAEIEAFLRAHPHIEDPHLFDVGQNIGEWRITAFIGKGGSGEVYSAKHSDLGFIAAIKILSRDDQVAKDRFQREAQVFAENPMPVFPRFFGYGQINGRPYMVIELLEHLPLPSEDRAVAQYLLKVCVGVGRLHSLGLVHRDIKPQNILQRGTTGEPVLIDLGLVKDVTLPVAHRGESLSIVNGKAVGVGTPRYAAPEQFAGGKISPAADIHALGMLANDCFGGNPPLPWARIIRRSTSSIPSQRYGSVAQFAKAIRHRHWVNLLVVVFLLLGAVLAGVSYLPRMAKDKPNEVLKVTTVAATNIVQEPASEVRKQGARVDIQSNSAPKEVEDNKIVSNVVQRAERVPEGRAVPRGAKALGDEANVRKQGKASTAEVLKVEATGAPQATERPQKAKKWPQQGSFSGDKKVDQDFW